MQKISFEQTLLILAIVFLPLNRLRIHIPVIASNLSQLFLVLGVLYFLYKVIAGKEILERNERYFLCFLGAFTLWKCICTVVGVYEYSYYDLVRVEQAGKVQYVLKFLHIVGLNADKLTAFKVWIGIRYVIACIIDLFGTYGISLWVYHLYKKNKEEDPEKQPLIFTHILFAVSVLCTVLIIYSVFEIGYLRGNRFCADLLSAINPLLYEVKSVHGWWPPLLWPNQLRSLFAEPSFFGIGSTFVVPFLFYKMMEPRKNYLFYAMYGAFAVMLFMTRARTAIIIFLLQLILLLAYVFGFSKKHIKKTLQILCISSLSFCIALGLMSGFKPVPTNSPGVKPKAKVQAVQPTVPQKALPDAKISDVRSAASDYVKDNITSITGNTRSNNARFANVRATFLTGIQHPIFGVGRELSTAYANANFTKEDLNNPEVRGWSDFVKRDGAFKSPIPVLNELSIEIAQYGIPGLLLFLLPVLCILKQLFKLYKHEFTTEIACAAIAYLGSLAALFSNIAFFTYYVLTGLMIIILQNSQTRDDKSRDIHC